MTTEQKPAPVFWYMRDNHTFRKLTGSPAEMVAQCLEEFDAGYNYGSLCVSHVPGFVKGVHASGPDHREDFRLTALAAIDAALVAGKGDS
ncbi:hypothetical protein J2X90_000744 [Variovorax paradoxus]|uniref:hypothetical protein n=1 Tax=Variovorax paradoxus TaxID=34073 RepID=UPI002788A9B4|nr:hypothetical protein [Variovorax paradoxus]MDQ0022958.1 hypothetical protein [Variovorax paradoxus]